MMTRIEAENSLLQMKLNAYPHMKAEEQKKLHRKLWSLAYPKSDDKEKTTEEMAKIIMGLSNG